ncbi:MAG TPA: hypothetical protein EYG94_02290 [Campylobacterales bacterium]|nr:hypothetical protein [Campylobacterales bacterium]
MKAITIAVLFFPFLSIGCGESVKAHSESEKNQKSNSDVNVTSISPKEDILGELGFNIKNQKISIDLNKTTNFLKKMEIEMHGKADELQHKIEKADINFTRDIGINFSDEKLEIDLNKTKNMFQQINILMKEVLLDINNSKY